MARTGRATAWRLRVSHQPSAISSQDATADPTHPGSFVTGDPDCSASAAGLRIIPCIVRITAVPRPPMTYRRPGPACRPRPGRTPRRPGPATVIELLAGAGLAAGPDPAPGKRVPASRSAAPPSPIGLTAAALSAGAERERPDSRDARPPGTLTCARCPRSDRSLMPDGGVSPSGGSLAGDSCTFRLQAGLTAAAVAGSCPCRTHSAVRAAASAS